MIFGILISLFMEPYMELLISAYLNIKAPVTTNNGDISGIITVYITSGIACVILPLTYLWVITRNQSTLKDLNFSQTWDSFYSETRGRKVSQMMFNFVSLLRRLLFVITVLLFDHSTFQVMSLLITNIFVSLYLIIVMPLSRLRHN